MAGRRSFAHVEANATARERGHALAYLAAKAAYCEKIAARGGTRQVGKEAASFTARHLRALIGDIGTGLHLPDDAK